MKLHDLKFTQTTWSVKELISHIEDGTLNLQPHYQRNAIWTGPAQRRLITTLKRGYPVPNIFARRVKSGKKYEIVDGQQRCRALLAYWKGDLADEDRQVYVSPSSAKGKLATPEWIKAFAEYPLQVSLLDGELSDKEVEDFYVLLNRSGVRLNSPELRKAEFYDTRFLATVNKVCALPEFEELRIFGEASVDRMNDVEFVSELLALLAHGFSDKKEKVDAMFESDIDEKTADKLVSRAASVIGTMASLNREIALQQTRYKQKNDFYTLFAFLDRNQALPAEAKLYIYRSLVRLQDDISPSQEECEPLMVYALNCVSQSNSKDARVARDEFFISLFENKGDKPTDNQSAIAKYFKLPKDTAFVRKWDRLLLNNDLLLRS